MNKNEMAVAQLRQDVSNRLTDLACAVRNDPAEASAHLGEIQQIEELLKRIYDVEAEREELLRYGDIEEVEE